MKDSLSDMPVAMLQVSEDMESEGAHLIVADDIATAFEDSLPDHYLAVCKLLNQGSHQ